MPLTSRLPAGERRVDQRHKVQFRTEGETRDGTTLSFEIANISRQGFMGVAPWTIDRGDRLLIRLPVLGQIEAFLAWVLDERAGFQFERLISPIDFERLLTVMTFGPESLTTGNRRRKR
ncbi:MAG TPA: PilZ domain-containing protein [Novosphingobium sp.]|nr:PilZ domain-containing protein [Novosphingobium sp.]